MPTKVAFATTTPEQIIGVAKAVAATSSPLEEDVEGGVPITTISEGSATITTSNTSSWRTTSERSTDSNSNSTSTRLSKSPKIRGNLTRQHKNRDPSVYYDVLCILGEGSMGSVAKVQKKLSMIGGSARFSSTSLEDSQRDENNKLQNNTPQQQKCFTVPLVGGMFRWCLNARKDENSTRSTSMVHAVTPTSSMRSTASSSNNDATTEAAASPSGELLLDSSTNNKTSYRSNSSNSSTQMIFAMKSIHLKFFKNQAIINELQNEVEILKTLDHPHIVRVIETFDYREQMFVVMDLCSGGDLYTRDPYTEEEAARIVGSILSAVAYMHAHGV
jgi:serine/threonine protein kinase